VSCSEAREPQAGRTGVAIASHPVAIRPRGDRAAAVCIVSSAIAIPPHRLSPVQRSPPHRHPSIPCVRARRVVHRPSGIALRCRVAIDRPAPAYRFVHPGCTEPGIAVRPPGRRAPIYQEQ